MKNNIIIPALLLLQSMLLASCEEAYKGEESGNQDQYPLSLRITSLEQIPFGSSRASIRELCTRIDCAVFDDTGKVKAVRQDTSDASFGTLSLSLPRGIYRIVVIAHNGLGAATISQPEEITFRDNKVTDTFYHYGELTIEEATARDITLRRPVAMFRLVASDNTPQEASQVKFYYTGGSSTFNAVTGYGCKNSRQTETRDVPQSAYLGPSQYEIYTFPHTPSDDKLKITATALGPDGESILERTFSDIPVAVNKITQYTGQFFRSDTQASNTFSLDIADEWQQDDHTY